jgi:hypothetical protein
VPKSDRPAPPYTAAVLRSLLAAVLVLLLIPAAALANTATWASRTVQDRDAFTTTVERALDTSAAEGALARRLSVALVDALLGTDDRIRFVLGPLVGAGVTASDDELVDGLQVPIRVALDDARTEAARRQLVVDVHAAVVSGQTGGSVRVDGDRLVYDVRDILEAVVAALDPRLQSLAGAVVAVARTDIELATVPGLETAGENLDTLDRLATVLALLAIAVGLLVLVLAHRRQRAAGLIGLALAIAGLIGLGVVAAGGSEAAGAGSSIDPALVRETWDALARGLADQSILLIAIGLLVAGMAFLAGLAPARRSRRAAGDAEPW